MCSLAASPCRKPLLSLTWTLVSFSHSALSCKHRTCYKPADWSRRTESTLNISQYETAASVKNPCPSFPLFYSWKKTLSVTLVGQESFLGSSLPFFHRMIELAAITKESHITAKQKLISVSNLITKIMLDTVKLLLVNQE